MSKSESGLLRLSPGVFVRFDPEEFEGGRLLYVELVEESSGRTLLIDIHREMSVQGDLPFRRVGGADRSYDSLQKVCLNSEICFTVSECADYIILEQNETGIRFKISL